MRVSKIAIRYVIAATVAVLIHLMLFQQPANAGLLEIPEITHSTPLKGKSVFENIDVPPVRERDPNPESGARIWVREIKVQGVVNRPKYGITVESVEKYVENLRQMAMREEELLKYGYSLEELAEIADLMLEIDANNNLEQVTEPDLQKLIWLVREQKEKRGLTLGHIESIAEQLTMFYRKRGFFLAKVYIPSQEVRDGVVGMNILEGMLGDVSITGNDRYDSEFIIKTFNDLKYQPVNERDIEQKLYLLNDYPGLELYGYFKAGQQVGDTQLNLQVRRENPWTATARVDNYGSELTGRERMYAQLDWHNPFRVADDITFGVLQSVAPDNSTYGLFRYRVPIYSEQFHAGIMLSRNQFVIGESRSSTDVGELSGETSIMQVGLDYSLYRSREQNWSFSINYADKQSDISSERLRDLSESDESEISDNEVVSYELAMNYDRLSEASRILNQVGVSLFSGEVKRGAGRALDEEFNKLTLRSSFLSFLTIPWLEWKSRLIVKTQLQYTDAVLPPVEQFSLGGPNVVRAFSVTDFNSDSGAFVGVDMVFDMPGFLDFSIARGVRFARVVRPFLFVDYAYGQLNEIDAFEGAVIAEEFGRLSGYGFGLQLNYRNKVSGNLQFAMPLTSDFSDEFQNEPDDDIRLVADFQYVFD